MARVVLVNLMAYLLGCFSAGYLVVFLAKGRDIRTHASGSTGSRNVGRVLGTGGFLLTLACDAGKVALAVGLSRPTAAGPPGCRQPPFWPPWLAMSGRCRCGSGAARASPPNQPMFLSLRAAQPLLECLRGGNPARVTKGRAGA